jgi:hypothetical protein
MNIPQCRDVSNLSMRKIERMYIPQSRDVSNFSKGKIKCMNIPQRRDTGNPSPRPLHVAAPSSPWSQTLLHGSLFGLNHVCSLTFIWRAFLISMCRKLDTMDRRIKSYRPRSKRFMISCGKISNAEGILSIFGKRIKNMVLITFYFNFWKSTHKFLPLSQLYGFR